MHTFKYMLYTSRETAVRRFPTAMAEKQQKNIRRTEEEIRYDYE